MALRISPRRASFHEATPLLTSTTQDPANIINETEAGRDECPHISGNEDDTSKASNEDIVPLPMDQVFILCMARLVDPISFFCIFPFLPKMVEGTGVEPADVGFYTGVIESLASVMQCFTMLSWGKAADYYGRKPILIISIIGVSVATTCFGYSRTVWQMILFRCLSGSFTGSVVSIRAMFHEISTPKTTARAFSWFAFAGNIGIFLGPAIGSLARPAVQYPGIFGNIEFLKTWPYMLPTAIVGLIGAFAAVLCIIFLKETLPVAGFKLSPGYQKLSTWELLNQPGVPISLLAFGYSSMLGFAFTAICPVFFYTPISLGGFGLSERLISLFISLNGISQAMWLLIAFPSLHRRIGTRKLLIGCGVAWPIFMLSFPLNNFFLRHHMYAAFWAVTPTLMSIGSGVAMAFTGVQLAVNEASPSPEVLGTLNGVALTVQTGIRAIVPALFSSIFAFGVDKQILGGELGMLVLVPLTAGFYFVARALTSAKVHAERGEEERRPSDTMENNAEQNR